MVEIAERIAILGGTFNPIHNAHIYLVRTFAEKLNTERVLTVVTNIPPHKQGVELADNAQRLEMCYLAKQEEPRIVPCDIELRREGKSYTCDTLRMIHDENPQAELFFIMGADMFLTLRHWKNPEEIFKHATICATLRDESKSDELYAYEKQLESLGAKCMIETVTPPKISSTEIRQAVSEGKSLQGFVPKAVEEYIYKNGLYRAKGVTLNG